MAPFAAPFFLEASGRLTRTLLTRGLVPDGAIGAAILFLQFDHAPAFLVFHRIHDIAHQVDAAARRAQERFAARRIIHARQLEAVALVPNTDAEAIRAHVDLDVHLLFR